MIFARLFLFALCYFPLMQLNAQWTPTAGPMGGQVNDMIQHENKLFAACGYFGPGALYYSEDDGISWNFVNDELPVNAKYTALAETSSSLFLGVWLNGIYRSMDGGQNWTLQNNGISETGISISCIYGHEDTLYAGSFTDGMYFSTDEGENWELRSNGLQGAAKRIADFTKLNNVLFASTPLGIYKTTDEGLNWELSSTGIPNDVRYSYSVHHHEGILYAGSIAGLYRSDDLGNSWSLEAGNLITGSIHDMQTDGNTLYVLTAYSVIKTDDGGGNWEEIHEGLPEWGSLKSLYAENNILLSGTVLQGTYRFDHEMASWGPSSKGINNISVFDIVHDANKLIAVTLDADFGLVFASDNNGGEWYVSNTGATQIGYLCLLSTEDQIYAGSDGSYLFRSGDHAQNWEQVDINEFPASYVGALTENAGVIFGSGIGFNIDVFRSFDQGLTFEACNTPGQGNINALYADGNFIYAGRTDGIFRSSDNGGNWEDANSGLPDLPFVSSINGDGNYIYTNTNMGSVFRSADHGEQWEEIFTAGFQNRIIEIEASEDYVFLGSKTDGIFYSLDHGENWEDFNSGLVHGPEGHYPEIISMDIKGDSLYAGTIGYGVWVSPLPHITGNSNELSEKVGLKVLSIFPNPLSKGQNFNIQLKEEFTGNITIFDLQGRKISQIYRGPLQAGTHNFQLNNDLEAGVYLLLAESREARYINKLIVDRGNW